MLELLANLIFIFGDYVNFWAQIVFSFINSDRSELFIEMLSPHTFSSVGACCFIFQAAPTELIVMCGNRFL